MLNKTNKSIIPERNDHMKIKLNKLTIRNFKGIKEYELAIDGESANVAGDNGTGKTTLYDSFLWCLFGKDSTDKAQFDWKPLDEHGNEINHLETEVIAEIEIDGKETKLSRMIEERWTKKRGSATETFSGHTTTFKIDDLTVKKKDYEDSLNELISEDLFKLLTSVNYFPETLKWNERRETLIEMVGDVSDSDVISQNKELEGLRELIEQRPADELKQLTAQQMRHINKDLKAIPDRIDEVDRGLPDVSELNKGELITQRTAIGEKILIKQGDVAQLQNSDAAVKAKSELADLKVQYRELEMDYKEEQAKELEETLAEQERLEDWNRKNNNRLSEIEQELKNYNSELTRKNTAIEELEQKNESLRVEFKEVQAKSIDSFEEHQMTCPTCKQELPADQLIQLKDEHEEKVQEFNQKKANQIKLINESGKANVEQIEQLKKEIKELEVEEITKKDEQVEGLERQSDLTTQIKAIEEEVKKIRAGQNPFAETEEAIEITKKAEELKAQIKLGTSSVDEEVEEINNQIKGLQKELSEISDFLQQFELYKQQSKRKEELIKQEQELAVKYGELEQQLHLLEEFTRTKVNLLTDTINNKFKHVKFKLFEEQINGGLTEICEVTMNGANYSTGLNNAARINAGLDIINTLMDHYKIKVPVFIDNAESINEIIKIDTQLITLSVSNHKRLNVSKI